MAAERQPTIWVIAGPNGGGKSSIIGEVIRAAGADYFNPDEYTRQLCDRNPGLPVDAANALAWAEGKRRLEEAIAGRQTLAFESLAISYMRTRSRSACTISATSSRNVYVGRQPRTARAFAGSPARHSTSAGRSNRSSVLTKSR